MVKKIKKENKLYKALDPFFKFTLRGSNIKTELYAGLLMFISVACTALVGANLLSQGVNLTDGATFNYAMYFLIALTSAISTILIGVLCNAPLVSSTSLGIISLIISIYGANKGLTYMNIIAIALVSNIIYLLVMVIKPARTFMLNAIPTSIRKVIPAMLGAYMIMYSFVELGVFKTNSFDMVRVLVNNSAAGDPISTFGLNYVTFNNEVFASKDLFYTYMPIVMALVIFVIAVILKKFKIKHSIIISFGVSFLIYLALWAIRGKWTDYYLYAFITPSYGSMYYYQSTKMISRILKSNYILKVFKTGFDFTAYKAAVASGEATGNVFSLFVSSVLSFLVVGVSESASSTLAVAYRGDLVDENGSSLAISNESFKKAADYINVYSVNALGCVTSAFLGFAPNTIRSESVIGSDEGGRTGLSAIFAGLLFIVTIFNMVFNALFINGTIVYGLTILAGLSLLTSLKNIDFEDFTTALAGLAMVVIAGVSLNIGLALTVGILIDLLIKMLSFKFKEINIASYALGLILILNVIL